MRRLHDDVRRKIMASIRSKNTMPELLVRSALHKAGFRFRLNDRSLPGTPDVVLPRFRTVIWVHGCFWHHHEKCKDGRIPQRNRAYWNRKFKRNALRDAAKATAIRKQGWKAVVIWECHVRNPKRLRRWVDRMCDRLL